MDKITGLGILDVFFGFLLVLSKGVLSRRATFVFMLNKVGIPWNSFELVLNWLYLPASVLLIGTGLILVGYIVVLR